MTFLIVALEILLLGVLGFLFLYIKRKIDAERKR